MRWLWGLAAIICVVLMALEVWESIWRDED
jgi:hypothetical protein